MGAWKMRLAGGLLMGVGALLFVLSVQVIAAGGLRVLVGLAAVFCFSLGFGFLILPAGSPPPSKSKSTLNRP